MQQFYVQGVPIKTDKPVTSIQGTQVIFADDSVCDVALRHFDNKGFGDLKFGKSQLNPPESATGPLKLKTSNLNIHNVAGRIYVINKPGDMELSIRGTAEAVKRVQVKHDGSTLEIFSSLADTSEVTILVSIPLYGMLTLKDIKGSLFVDEAGRELILELSQPCTCDIKRVRKSTITISDEVGCQIGNAVEELRITFQETGKGNLVVSNGQIDDLRVTILGSGNVTCNGNVEKADLKIQGQGTINVRRIRQRPERSVTGRGRIDVANW